MDTSDSVAIAIHVVGQCVRVAGEVDVLTAPLVEDAILALSDPVLLDLADVTFMDSTGLHVLIRCRRSRPQLRVTAVSPKVERLIAITDMHCLMEPSVLT